MFTTTNLGDVHVSGHGGREDYKKMLGLVRPKAFIPAHGEYRHLVLHGRLAAECGVADDQIFIVEDGQVVGFGRFNGKEIAGRLGEKVTAGHVYVDGLGVAMLATSSCAIVAT